MDHYLRVHHCTIYNLWRCWTPRVWQLTTDPANWP